MANTQVSTACVALVAMDSTHEDELDALFGDLSVGGKVGGKGKRAAGAPRRPVERKGDHPLLALAAAASTDAEQRDTFLRAYFPSVSAIAPVYIQNAHERAIVKLASAPTLDALKNLPQGAVDQYASLAMKIVILQIPRYYPKIPDLHKTFVSPAIGAMVRRAGGSALVAVAQAWRDLERRGVVATQSLHIYTAAYAGPETLEAMVKVFPEERKTAEQCAAIYAVAMVMHPSSAKGLREVMKHLPLDTVPSTDATYVPIHAFKYALMNDDATTAVQSLKFREPTWDAGVFAVDLVWYMFGDGTYTTEPLNPKRIAVCAKILVTAPPRFVAEFTRECNGFAHETLWSDLIRAEPTLTSDARVRIVCAVLDANGVRAFLRSNTRTTYDILMGEHAARKRASMATAAMELRLSNPPGGFRHILGGTPLTVAEQYFWFSTPSSKFQGMKTSKFTRLLPSDVKDGIIIKGEPWMYRIRRSARRIVLASSIVQTLMKDYPESLKEAYVMRYKRALSSRGASMVGHALLNKVRSLPRESREAAQCAAIATVGFRFSGTEYFLRGVIHGIDAVSYPLNDVVRR